MEEKLIKYLKDLKSYGQQNNIPNVSETGGQFLNMLVKLAKPKTILEIGCANGYSTIWLAQAAQSVGAEIHTIDHSKPTFEQAQKNIKEADFSDITHLYFGSALEVIDHFPKNLQFDFVFVDGEKRSYLDFWKKVEPRLAPHALVVFDDMMAFPKKTKPFSDFLESLEGFEKVLLPIDKTDGIMLLYKKD